MDETIIRSNQLWSKIQAGNISSFTLADVIWLIGIVVVIIFAAKIGYKFLKLILVLLAIACLVGYLFYKGYIPL